MCCIGKLSIGNLPVHPTPTKSAQDRFILSRIIFDGSSWPACEREVPCGGQSTMARAWPNSIPLQHQALSACRRSSGRYPAVVKTRWLGPGPALSRCSTRCCRCAVIAPDAVRLVGLAVVAGFPFRLSDTLLQRGKLGA